MTLTRDLPAGSSSDPVTSPRRWWVLAALVLVVVVFDLNLTMINIALPTLATELDASSAQLQWFSGAYSLMVAAVLLPAGLLGDRFGAKRPLLIALLVLGVTAIACTQATTPGQLIAGQLVLGAAAGFLPSLTLALIKLTFPAQELTRAMAIWSVGMTLGIPLGPIVGGVLISEFGWASIYWLNVPLVLLGAAMLAVLLPARPGSPTVQLDLPGVGLSSLGIVAATYGFTRAGEVGWGAPSVLLPLGVGTALLALLVIWVRRAEGPIIDPMLFRAPRFRAGVILSTLVTFTLMGAVFTVPQYFHIVHGAGPLGTGLHLMPIIVGLMLGVVLAGPLRRHLSQHTLIAAGFALLAAGTTIGAVTPVSADLAVTSGWLALAGMGIGFTMPTSIALAMEAVPEHRSGVGSGVLQAVRQVGGTFGIALLGTLLASVYSSSVEVTGLSGDQAEAVRRSAAGGLGVAQRAGDAALSDSVQSAFVAGMGATLWVSAGLAVIGGATALWMRRANSPGSPGPRPRRLARGGTRAGSVRT